MSTTQKWRRVHIRRAYEELQAAKRCCCPAHFVTIPRLKLQLEVMQIVGYTN